MQRFSPDFQTRQDLVNGAAEIAKRASDAKPPKALDWALATTEQHITRRRAEAEANRVNRILWAKWKSSARKEAEVPKEVKRRPAY
jgi:hypothetical protein